jgi:HTH-type transcriptional regulator/antitoxin HigA
MDIKPIRTAQDHARALKEIESLWGKAEPGTPQAERFEVLSTLVDAYEDEHFPIELPDPIEAIKIRVEEKGMTSRDLLPIFGTTARTSEILNRKRGLSLEMIRELHERLNIPSDILIQRYQLKDRPPRKPALRRATSSKKGAAKKGRAA